MDKQWLFIFFVIYCSTLASTTNNNKTKIYFGAFIPDMDYDQWTFRSAMETAVELINKDEKLLKDYELNIVYNESFRGVYGFATKLLQSMVKDKPIKQIILGPGYSKAVGKLIPFATFHCLPQISYTARQRFNTFKVIDGRPVKYANLQDKPYPFYVRLTPSHIDSNTARVKLFQQQGWKRVAIIVDNGNPLLFDMSNDLTIQLKKAGIKVLTTEIVRVHHNYINERINIIPQINKLIEVDARIIVLLTSGQAAEHVFCDAYRKNLYGTKYTWVLNDKIPDHFYKKMNNLNNKQNTNCTEQEYLEIMDGMLNPRIVSLRNDMKPTVAGLPAVIVAQMIAQRKIMNTMFYNMRNPANPQPPYDIYEVSTYAFDTVYAAAIAMDKIIKEKGRSGLITRYPDRQKALAITQKILESDFEGLAGRVWFGNETGNDDRLGQVYIRQWYSENNFKKGSFKNVALFDGPSGILNIFKKPNNTIFNDGRIRRDGTITVHKILKLTSLKFLINIWCFTAIGVIIAIVFLSINIRYRGIRLIKMSSPNINNGIILGSLMLYASIILYGIDTRFLTVQGLKNTCNVLPAMLSIGFSFLFGCLFSKTWRVYKIFAAARTMEKVNTAALKDGRLYILVFVLVGIDVIICGVWILISPFQLKEIIIEEKKVGIDSLDSFFYYKCTCEYEIYFTVTVYCYKGLLLALGLFLAWETRNIKVAALNDSQYISMAVYNVVVVTVVGVTCAYSLTDATNYHLYGYLIVAISIFLCTTVTILVVFAPKLRLLFGKSINTSLERAMSVQTFSFAASVQNRTPKKEMTAQESNRSDRSNSSVN